MCKAKFILCFCACLMLTVASFAQDLVAYHVVGKVTKKEGKKSVPITVNTILDIQTEITVSKNAQLELLDEASSRRIVIRNAGRGKIADLLEDKNNSVMPLSASYVARIKRQLGNKRPTAKDLGVDSAQGSNIGSSKADSKSEPAEDLFETFKKDVNKKFESFRDECNQRYIDFVRQPWALFEQEAPIERPKDQKMTPVIFEDTVKTDKLKIFNIFSRKRKAHKVIALDETFSDEAVQPQPIEPITEIKAGNEVAEFADMPFEFYGTELHVRLDDSKRVHLNEVSPDKVADALQHFSTKSYDNLLYDCLQIRYERKLCDWAYLLMLQKLSEKYYGAGTNESTLLLGYLYYQSGYKIRFATNGQRLFLLVASKHVIYGQGAYRVDNELFYPTENIEGGICICPASFPNESSLSLYVPEQPILDITSDAGHEIISERYPDFKISYKINQNLMNLYQNYPSSNINNDFTTTWAMYANTPLAKNIQDQIYPELRSKLQGLSEVEALNRLLNLIQTGMTYGLDNTVWGGERVFFAEESLFYPFCDCEDRAILFTRLVRDLLNLDCALVYYPGHLASAVKLSEAPVGSTSYMTADGNAYTVCDPTYINAGVGREMPDFENVQAQLILLKK